MEVCAVKTGNRIKDYFWLFVCVCLCYLVGRISGLHADRMMVQLIMIMLLSGLVSYVFFKKLNGTLTENKITSALVFAGCIMRIGYMIYTPCNIRGHDLWEIDVNSFGHAAYILNLMELGSLPQSSEIQLYQQPFFYIIGSLVSKVLNGVLRCNEAFFWVDATKVVSCFASCGMLYLTNGLSDVLQIKGRERNIALIVVAFLPAFYLAGGMVSPDALTGFMMTLAWYLTLCWYQDCSWKNTIFLAITYGLAMLTKNSCGVIAIFTALLFVSKLIEEVKAARGIFIVVKYFVFAAISLPLGLWYSVRNYIRFQQPLGYVLEIGEDSFTYTGQYSMIARLIGIDWKNLLQTPYADVGEDYNAPVYFLKSALFGEFTYSVEGMIPVLLLLAAFILSIGVVAEIVSELKGKVYDGEGKGILIICLLYYGSIVGFNIRYPHACSMDYRYMLFLTIPAGFLLGKNIVNSKNVWYNNLLLSGLLLYIVNSCIMYTRI